MSEKDPRPRVAVCIPNMGTVLSRTVMTLLGLMEEGRPFAHMIFMTVEGCYVHSSRIELVQQAIEHGADYVFFVDADVTFPPETLEHLLALDKDVVGAQYNMRRLPATSTVKTMDEHGTPTAMNRIPTELFKAYAVPTGCVLIKTSVFEKIPRPWFFFKHKEDGSIEVGEDVWFCQRVREAGYDVWCDPTVPVQHHGLFAY